ncbi:MULTISPECIES: CgeB family protein [Empedobacter]|uniref:CgeB family protein n=1 Tax=Empedobacter TaxID=59734 RepID=UPI002578308B|nr:MULTISPECIES: glycosyltransferase [Empedobacter]MDM1042799.1 glycosyltransferase [Empedobacter brevis]MDM1136729.1 glycosyltransferase [Empedobacter sp. R750]
MKIALLGSKNFDSLEYHLNDTLLHLGYNVFHIDISDVINIPYRYSYWASKLFSKYDLKLFLKIARRIIDEKPDLVICTYRFIHPECIKMIKRESPTTKVIHINPDAITTFENQQIFASPYDAYFTKDPFIVNFMKDKMGLNTFYLPEALNPRVHKPLTNNRIELENKVAIDVVAFGTMYPYRAKMVSKLIEKDINVALFGVPDKRYPREEITNNFRNEYIVGERKSEVLSGSKIVFNNFHYAEIQSANVKFFEIAGIGGFQICDYKETLQEYSVLDVKDFTYKNINEAIELIQHYLPLTDKRHSMADLQMKHFHKYHTYEKRIEQVLNSL